MARQASDLQLKKSPKQARSKATVDAICGAAARLMEEEGYAAVTTNRVAERAGVSVGSLYEYFPNKQSIVAAALAAALRDIVAEVGRSLHEALALPDQPRAGIDHWMRAIVGALEARAGLLRVALSEVPFLGEIPEARGLSQTLEQLVRKGRDKSAAVVRLYDPGSQRLAADQHGMDRHAADRPAPAGPPVARAAARRTGGDGAAATLPGTRAGAEGRSADMRE